MRRFFGITTALVFAIFTVSAVLMGFPWYEAPLVGVGGVAASALMLTIIALSIGIPAAIGAWLLSKAFTIAVPIYLKTTGHSKGDIEKIMAKYRTEPRPDQAFL